MLRFADRYWFGLTEDTAIRRFRVVLAIAMVCFLISAWQNYQDGLSAIALHLPETLLDAGYHSLQFPLLPPQLITPVYLAIVLASASVGVFRDSRLATISAFIGWLYLFEADYVSTYTVHKLVLAALLILSLAPAPYADGRRVAWPLRLLQLTISFMYLGNGVGKVIYGDWLDHPQFLRVMVDGIYRNSASSWMVMNLPAVAWSLFLYGALMIELSWPILVCFRRTRMIALAFGLLLHGTIALLMQGLWVFSAVVCAFYALFLPEDGAT
jgi:hypothetical protein